MIKFFRHIRKKLLGEGKTGKYFKYAIGEIVLVVIGILIALQINNWNEEQKANQWEQRFLTDLQNELKSDYTQLNKVYTMQMTKRKAAISVLDLIKVLKKENKSILDSIYTKSQEGNMTFFPTTGVYDSGMSAGKIENLKNDALKYAIMNLYNHFYKRLVYNGSVLDEVVGQVDWENRIYYNKTTQQLRSWEVTQEYEFSAQIRFLLAQNLVYTNLVKANLNQINKVITMINTELNND